MIDELEKNFVIKQQDYKEKVFKQKGITDDFQLEYSSEIWIIHELLCQTVLGELEKYLYNVEIKNKAEILSSETEISQFLTVCILHIRNFIVKYCNYSISSSQEINGSVYRMLSIIRHIVNNTRSDVLNSTIIPLRRACQNKQYEEIYSIENIISVFELYHFVLGVVSAIVDYDQTIDRLSNQNKNFIIANFNILLMQVSDKENYAGNSLSKYIKIEKLNIAKLEE